MGGLVVIVVGVLVINYFRNLPTTEESGDVSLSGIASEIGGGEIHTVEPGETLWEISEEYYDTGYEWQSIAEENKLTSPDEIEEGQELIIPNTGKEEAQEPQQMADQAAMSNNEQKPTIQTGGTTYTVKHGDTLWDIAAQAYGDPYRWVDIASANNLANPDLIHAGNVFVLPD